MAKESLFQAYDLRRKIQHTLTSPPAKIHAHRVNHDEWAQSGAHKVSKKCGKKANKTKKKMPKSAVDILRCRSGENQCLHCGKYDDDAECGINCYKQFKKANSIASKIDIKGPAKLGYGAYTKPGVRIQKGAWLDDYIGELRPLHTESDTESLYRFEIPSVCAVDAEKAGNWTRFINSDCRPNVKPWGEFLGGRHVILFQALRAIGPEEEILFDYGRKYFEKAGFECCCGAFEAKHMPGVN